MIKKKQRGINIEVSLEAHKKMRDAAYNSKPRLTLRSYVNIINKVPKEL